MERYPPEITSLLAPLIIIQGLNGERDSVGIGSDKVECAGKDGSSIIHHEKLQDASVTVPSISSDDNLIYRYLRTSKNVTLIERNISACDGQIASSMLNLFLKYDISDAILPPCTTKGFIKQYLYNFKFIGSKFYLPKFNIDVCQDPSRLQQKNKSEDDYMPISPFCKQLPYFGTILPLEWIQLYREIFPATFISVYNIVVTGDQEQESASDRTLVKEISSIKHYLSLWKIKYLVILTCEDAGGNIPSILSTRVENIRLNTKLAASTGLKFLMSSEPKYVSNFVTSILHLVRPWCTDFYNNIIKYSKMDTPEPSLQYNKMLLYARSSLKEALLEELCGVTESSTRSMEYCYENLMNAFRDLSYRKPELWSQCRTLIDLTAIHIVRSYLLLGDVQQAYKKFAIHTQNVTALLPQNLKDCYSYDAWLATQVSWLADLIYKSPESIVNVSMPSPKTAGLNLLRTMSWKQNNKQLDNGWITPQCGFIYLHACSLIRRRKVHAQQARSDTTDPYMSLPLEKERKVPYSKICLRLLNSCLDVFSKSRKTKFNRTESYIYFQIAEEHFLDRNYSMAMNNYLVALQIYQEENWKGIKSILLLRIFQCLIKLGNYHDSAIYYLKLSLIPEELVQPLKVFITHPKLKLDRFLEESDFDERLTINDPILGVNAIFRNQEVLIGDTLTMQTVLTSEMNTLIDHAIVESVQFTFQNSNKRIVVKHRSDLEYKIFEVFQCDMNDLDHIEFESNLIFSGCGMRKVFNFDIISSSVGTYVLNEAKLILKTLDFNLESCVYLQAQAADTSVPWLQPFKGKNSISEHGFIKLSLPSTTFKVYARAPKVNIRFNYDEVAFDGFTFPIKFWIDNKDDRGYAYNVMVTASLLGETIHVAHGKPDNHVQASCGEIEISESKAENVFLSIPVSKANSKGEIHDSKRVVHVHLCFKFTSKVDGVTTETLKELNIAVKGTFKVKFSIQPGLGPNRSLLLNSRNSEDRVLTTNDRIWKTSVHVQNNSYMQLTLDNFDLKVVCFSSKTKVKLIDDDFYPTPKSIALSGIANESAEIPFILSSSCEEGTQLLSIDTKIYIHFNYKKVGKSFESDTIKSHIYKQLVWVGRLPLSDPRILVYLHELDNNLMELNYLIENPSDKSLQLHCTVSPSKDVEMHTIDFQFDLLVENKTSRIRKYRYELTESSEDKGLIRLPELKVYDTVHKLYLNQILVTDHIVLRKNAMYYVNLKNKTPGTAS